jgi:hypothetical protein
MARAGRPFGERTEVVVRRERDRRKGPQPYHGQRWNGQTMVFRDDGLVVKLEVADCVSDGISPAGRRADLMMDRVEF